MPPEMKAKCILDVENKDEYVATKPSLENPLGLFICNLCGLKFAEKWEVMAHRKSKFANISSKEFVKLVSNFVGSDTHG